MPTNATITPGEGGSAAWASVNGGLYDATIIDTEEMGLTPGYQGAPAKETLRFHFALDTEIDPETGEPIVLRWGFITKTLNPGGNGKTESNLHAIAVAAGMPPTKGVPFNVDDLIGKPVQVLVVVKDSQGSPRPQITNIMPAREGQQAGAVPTPAADDLPFDAPAEPLKACAVVGCETQYDHFTPRGTQLCGAHTAEDLG